MRQLQARELEFFGRSLARIPAGERCQKVSELGRLLEEWGQRGGKLRELRFLRGYSIKETASTMGLTVGNAKVLQLRALRKAASQGTLR